MPRPTYVWHRRTEKNMVEDVKRATVISYTIASLGLSGKKEKLLTVITNLDIQARAEGRAGCNAKNKTLGKMCGLAETSVSKYIREFRREGHLEAGTFHGHSRILNSNFHDAVIKERIEYKLSSSRTNGLGSSENEYGAAPYHRTGSSSSNTCTNQPSNKKERLSLFNDYFQKLSEMAKTLILKEYGEYTATLNKEKEKARLWFKENQDPEFVLDVIRKLIFIRRSPEFKTDLRFWGTISVNIACAYSYKDTILTTYQTLMNTRSENPTVEATSKEKTYQESTWRGLSDWASEKLTISSREILNSVTAKIENNEVQVYGNVPESIRMIITKYFLEETKEKMTVRFLDAPGSRENNKPPIISENKTPETKSGETVKNRKEVQEKINYRKGSYEDFLGITKRRVSKLDFQILKEAKYTMDKGILEFQTDIPENLKIHIQHYFKELIEMPYYVLFVDSELKQDREVA